MGVGTASLLITILAAVIALSPSFVLSLDPMGVALYWGQNSKEASLKTVCDTGLFGYINVAYLTVTSKGTALKLDGHCNDSASGMCTNLADDILHCQSQGVKVLISIRITGDHGKLVDSRELANNIEENYLSGNPDGPFGIVILDGVDFHVETPAPSDKSYWEEVARNLASKVTPNKVYLAASPQCRFPDETLDATIQGGNLDYVWVQFYNNPTCDYSSGVNNVLRTWNQWNMALDGENTHLFMGLPTDRKSVRSGYIPPPTVALCILPQIRESSNYKGLMLWGESFLDVSNSIPCMGKQRQGCNIKMISEK